MGVAYWSSPLLDLVENGVLGAGGHRSRVRCVQQLRSNGLSLDCRCVQVLTQQQPQLLVFPSEVVLLLPQSFSAQHGAVESPQQLPQLRELARRLEDRGQRSGGVGWGGGLLLWRLERRRASTVLLVCG